MMSDTAAARGWQAELDLGYALRGGRTTLKHRRRRGPLSVQRSFYPEGEICHNYILHPPGGVVGGDSLQINISTEPGAHCLLTTPGATKFYRSAAGQVGRQAQQLSVADGAVIEWLPQHTIFFPGADVALDTCIDIDPGGIFIGWEIHCFGLPSNRETFSFGRVRSRTRLAVGGDLRLVEQFNSNADATLLAATGLRGMAVQGCIFAAPCDEIVRGALEYFLQSSIGDAHRHPVGLTLVDEVLIVRAAGEQTEPMLELFNGVWGELRRHCLAKAPCLPRIWAT